MPTFATPSPITATFTTAGADVRLTASDRADTVVLVDGAEVKVEFADGRLTVEKSKPGKAATITVRLPAGSDLVLNTAKTDVHAEGSFGDCTVDLASGQVRLDHIAALRGRLAGGDVEIGHLTGPATIDGGSATVRLGHALSTVEYSGASGSLTIDNAEGDVVAKAADCPLRISSLAGQAELTNAAGGIEVGIASGMAAEVDAESTKGTVHNSVPARPGATVKVYARTRRGDIVIRQA